jgi:predicted nucleotidyltransferase
MDLAPYVATLRARERALRDDRARWTKEARSRLPDLVRILHQEFNARRIILFGSLARDDVREDSDIDLAVDGLAPRDYWRALDRLISTAGRAVDLVPLEGAPESLRDRLAREGEVLLG